MKIVLSLTHHLPLSEWTHTHVSGVTFLYRNEAFQEQLWEISINAVKDWLSPDILAKYGPTDILPNTKRYMSSVDLDIAKMGGGSKKRKSTRKKRKTKKTKRRGRK